VCTFDFGSSSDGGGGVSSFSATSQSRSGCNETAQRQWCLVIRGKEMVGVDRHRVIGAPSQGGGRPTSNYVCHQGFGFQTLIITSVLMIRIGINFISFPL
jgi:hypothetical protein